jgi:hypothetical protein
MSNSSEVPGDAGVSRRLTASAAGLGLWLPYDSSQIPACSSCIASQAGRRVCVTVSR